MNDERSVSTNEVSKAAEERAATRANASKKAAKKTTKTAVKAATYHQFESHRTPLGWAIRVFVDV